MVEASRSAKSGAFVCKGNIMEVVRDIGFVLKASIAKFTTS